MAFIFYDEQGHTYVLYNDFTFKTRMKNHTSSVQYETISNTNRIFFFYKSSFFDTMNWDISAILKIYNSEEISFQQLPSISISGNVREFCRAALYIRAV